MRIGFDVSQTCVERAGCGWFADSLIRALVAQKTNNAYILYHHFGDWYNHSTAEGTSIDRPNVSSPMAGLSHAEAVAAWNEVRQGAPLPGRPDIVHANNFNAPRIRGARMVYTVYDVSFWLYPEFATEENRLMCQKGVLDAIRHADAFVFISENTRKDFLDMIPTASEALAKPMRVIPLGSRDWPKPVPGATRDAPESPYWLTIGSLEPRKNYDTLLDAQEIYWKTSPDPLPLWIAGGRGWKSEHTRSRIAKLEQSGIVRYLGYVDDKELPGLYRNAIGFVWPSWYEGFGLPILEAMNSGTPVICSDRGSLPEVGGDAVITINPAEASQIATEMRNLQANHKLQQTLIDRGFHRSKQFHWERSARLMVDLYQDVLGSRYDKT